MTHDGGPLDEQLRNMDGVGPAKRPKLEAAGTQVAGGAAAQGAPGTSLVATLLARNGASSAPEPRGGERATSVVQQSAQESMAVARATSGVGPPPGGQPARRRDVAVLQEAEERRKAATAAAAAKEDRLRCAATDFSLWRRPAADAFASAPAAYPGGVDEYIGTLEPLLFEEAREEVRAEWSAACEEGALHAVLVNSLRPDGDGWHVANLVPVVPVQQARFMAARGVLADGAVAVLSSGPPGRDPWRDFKAAAASDETRRPSEEGEVKGDADAAGVHRPGASALVHVAGFVVRVPALRRDEPSALYLRFHIPPDEEPGNRTLFFQPSDVLAALREGRSTTWNIASCGKLSTSLSEFRALHNVRHIHTPLRDALLHPAGCGAVLPSYDQGEPPRLAPELDLPAFTQHLATMFNQPQRCAIHWAAAAVAAVPGEGGEEGGAGAGRTWPFTLIQGPPGTGKTHTVWGMLNVLHLAAYQRYYRSLLAALAPRGAAMSQANAAAAAALAAQEQRAALYGDEGDDDEAAAAGGAQGTAALSAALAGLAGGAMARTLASLAAKPRILVCAPSNAAVDVLLTRCMDNGFIQGDGSVYHPDVVRLSAEDANMSDRVREVTVSRKMDALLRLSHVERQQALGQLQQAAHALDFRIHELRAHVDAAAAPHRSGVVLQPARLDELLRELVRLNEQLDRVLVDASRLQFISESDRSRGGPGGRDLVFTCRSTLEASFVNEAELVFTTLASSGRSVFARLEHGFDLVLIDEAAQASEVAALVPLRHGCKAAVLVGDPQQLPATVLSAAARAGLYTRSLFERLSDCGAGAMLLSVQYRMHPAIRSWPSRYFYSNRLEDSASVATAPDEPFYAVPSLQPYLVFDVSSGRDARGPGAGGSVHNLAEAALAAALYAKLKASLPAGAAAGRVGIVTPYRRQKQALRDALSKRMGEAVLAEVSIDTVDSFQGQEKDVIILSLVRAADAPRGSAGTGSELLRNTLGFVTDMRRMNVALTRAKRALWVLGHADSLKQSPQWADFLQDAQDRGLLVKNASVATLFPGELDPAALGARGDTRGLGFANPGGAAARWDGVPLPADIQLAGAAGAHPSHHAPFEIVDGGMFTSTTGTPLDAPSGLAPVPARVVIDYDL